MYINEEDARVVLAWLGQSSEIGFLVQNGIGRWKAVRELDQLPSVAVEMWHVPSGPLPLLGEGRDEPVLEVMSPWSGWTERRAGADARRPYFGPGWPGIMTLNIHLVSHRTKVEQTSSREAQRAIGLSGVEWVGNHYKIIGTAAKPETEKFWKKLRRFVASRATRVPRFGPIDGPNPEIYTFPSALAEIRNGRGRAANPE